MFPLRVLGSRCQALICDQGGSEVQMVKRWMAKAEVFTARPKALEWGPEVK